MSRNADHVSNLPFSLLTDIEFNDLFSGWPSGINSNDTDFHDLLSNPDKFDECDPDLMLQTPCSNYYSISELNKTINDSSPKTFSLFHCNIRSLSKNLHILEETLCSLDHKPDIMGITETKLNENSISNVNLEYYNFFHTDSTTNAGGAALYIADNLKASPRADIQFSINSVESCWSEIKNGPNKKPTIVGCIYRHPNGDFNEFTTQLNNIIQALNNKYQVYILGDFNIDLLRINSHSPTENYINMIYTNGLLPVITKPTRITNHTATLIDHIYTNTPISQIISGIVTVELSDHLPVFCLVNSSDCDKTTCKQYYRDYSHFEEDNFLNDISTIDWDNTCPE